MSQIWHKWKFFWGRLFARITDSQTSLAAAGVAFFATLSLFPALSALIPLYGLVFNVNTVEPQLEALRNLIPPVAFTLLSSQIHILVAQPHSSLTAGLVIALVIALWSASASSKSVISALNLVYAFNDERSFFYFQGLGVLTTFLGVAGACLTLALMVAAPAIVDYVPRLLSNPGIPEEVKDYVSGMTPLMGHWLAPCVMLSFVFLVMIFLYRFAPCWPRPVWRWIFPGAVLATLAWVGSSLVFSWIVAKFGMFGTVYGPLAAIAAVMMWLFVSAYVVLGGALFNTQLREQAFSALESRARKRPSRIR